MARRPGTRGPKDTQSRTRSKGGSTSRSRTSSRNKTSTRDKRGDRDRDNDRDRGRPGSRKKTKKNNTPLIIGISVGALLLLIIIIAAANSGGGGNATGSGDNYMSLSQKKSVYSEYVAKCKEIEQDAKDGLARLDAETRKMSSKMTGKKVRNLQEAAINRLQGKWKKKISGLPPEYIRNKVINYGKSNGW